MTRETPLGHASKLGGGDSHPGSAWRRIAIAKRRRSRNRRTNARRTGLILVVLLLLLLPNDEVDSAIVLGLSVAVVLWSLFLAPAWCGAVNRKRGREIEFCRNNSLGLLLGCHLAQHRSQKLKMLFYEKRWAHFTRGMWVTPNAILATISAIFGIVAPLVDWLTS